MSAMSNRTVLVDNNTWNNTHIATVGRALASSEEKAYPIMEARKDVMMRSVVGVFFILLYKDAVLGVKFS